MCQNEWSTAMTDLFQYPMTSVRPVSPPAAYIGGKRALAQRIAALIEQIPHKTYVEVFMGMGGVFFRRQLIPYCEVINDRSADVAGLFRILQRHLPQFLETIKFQLSGRKEFERLTKVDPSTLTDLERAARFIYLQRLAFGGKVSGRSFGVDRTGPARFNTSRLAPLFEEIHERLSGVVIECLDWSEVLRRYDGPDTLFYLDPPYWGCETDYGDGVFQREDFAEMAEQLAQIKGRFMISLNDNPGVREVFQRFEIIPVSLLYTIHGGAGKEVGEVIIMDGREPMPANLPRS